MLILWIAVLIVSLAVLVKAADVFTDYSAKLGVAFGLSSFIIGATIVAIGTSLPELVSSLFSLFQAGNTEFVADNIVGSNIANALLILGLGAIVAKTLRVRTSLIDVDLPFFFFSMGLFVFFSLDRFISPGEGLFLLGLFIIFLIYSTKADTSDSEESQDSDEMRDMEAEFKHKDDKEPVPVAQYMIYIFISVLLIGVSAKYLIDSVMEISAIMGITSSLLTITVVAIGTSLPEVLTSIAAIRRGNHGIAIGNVFGSNTFNLLLVGGFPALFNGLEISELTFFVGIPFLVVATLGAIFATLDDKVRVWEGVALFFLYAVFLAKVTQLI